MTSRGRKLKDKVEAPLDDDLRSEYDASALKDGVRGKYVTRYRNGLPPIRPGKFLAETLEELGVSQAQLARAIGVSPMRVSHVINGTRPVTAVLALLFGRALDHSPQYWLNLQAAYDLKAVEATIHKQLQAVARLASA